MVRPLPSQLCPKGRGILMAESTASSVASLALAETMNASFTLPMKFTRKSEPSPLPASHAKEKAPGELLPLRYPRLLGFGCAHGMFAVRQPLLDGAAGEKLGGLGPMLGWPVFMSMIVRVASVLGPMTGEWENTGKMPWRIQLVGVANPGDRGGCPVPRAPTGIGEMPEQFCG